MYACVCNIYIYICVLVCLGFRVQGLRFDVFECSSWSVCCLKLFFSCVCVCGGLWAAKISEFGINVVGVCYV